MLKCGTGGSEEDIPILARAATHALSGSDATAVISTVKHLRGKRFLIPAACVLALLVLAAFWMCYEKQEGIQVGPDPDYELFKYDPFGDFQASKEAEEFLKPGVTPRAILERIAAKDSGAAERWRLDEVEKSHTSSFSTRYAVLRMYNLLGELRDIPDHEIPTWLDSLLSYGQLNLEFGDDIEVSTPFKRISGRELDIPLRNGDAITLVRKNE
jgi:hypothetical protein